MKKTHSDFARSQYWILEALAGGSDPKRIAEIARKHIISMYGNASGTPMGAELDISVNDNCNLACSHCYYATTHDKSLEKKDGFLGKSDWDSVINSAIGLGFRHINIIGKEPLMTPEITFSILNALENAKQSGVEGIRYELITNGTLIEENIEPLRKFKNFYFFSISFDGYMKDHDKIRGKGNYEKSRRGL